MEVYFLKIDIKAYIGFLKKDYHPTHTLIS
jgi:hypothetical protein